MSKSALRRWTFSEIQRPWLNDKLIRPLRRSDRLSATRLVRRLPVVGTIEVDGVRGGSFTMVSDGRDSIASRLYWQGFTGYEPETVTTFACLVSNAEVVIDIGANSGVFSLLAAATNPDVRVFSFEPAPDVFEHLRRNIERNGFDQVTVEHMAVGASTGSVRFLVPDVIALPTGGSTLPGFRDDVRPVEVEATTLDDYVATHSIERVDVIKLDTEGTEADVIRGATQTLGEHRPPIICEILAGVGEQELEAALAEHDYRCYKMTLDGLVPNDRVVGDNRWKNQLLLPAERADEIIGTVGVEVLIDAD